MNSTTWTVPSSYDLTTFATSPRPLGIELAQKRAQMRVLDDGTDRKPVHGLQVESDTRIIRSWQRLRLPRVEDLLVMKAIAHRPKDLQDVEALLDAHPDLNLDSARRWIREFATAATMPDLLDDFEMIVTRCKNRR